DHTARTWESASGKLLQTWPGPPAVIAPMPIGPDGSVFGSDINRVYRAEAIGDRIVPRLLLDGQERLPVCVGVSPDGKLLAVRDRDRFLRLHSADTGKEVRRLEGDHQKHTVTAFSPDGKWLAGGGRNVPVIVWDTA